MNRREFILKTSSLALLPIVGCHFLDNTNDYPIVVHNDMHVGHKTFGLPPQYSDKIINTDVLVVGGGIAGLSAAVSLHKQKQEFLVCELSDRWGGTSSAVAYKGTHIAQGAHYELQYPAHFDNELVGFWEDLGVVSFNKVTSHWEFNDEQYIIAGNKEGRTWDGNVYRDDVLPATDETKLFLSHIEKLFLGKVKLPTRTISSDLYEFNQLTFLKYLKKNFPKLSKTLLRAIDYQMLDDYGGTSAQVSALAGIYYYGSRPYTSDENVVFSPSQGNYYFVEKMLENLPTDVCLLGRLVYKIKPEKRSFVVEVFNKNTDTIEVIRANKIIYAGQKHALKYIYPQDYPLFQHIEQAPWLVVNVVLKKHIDKPIFWQNEIVKENKSFLGFVNSLAQSKDKQVLSAYYCLKPEERLTLVDVEDKKAYWANYTLQGIADYFQMPLKALKEQVEQVFIQVMGHAMAIPTPHFLLNDLHTTSLNPHLAYAGADIGRLPLMLEATDSGIEAVKKIYK